MNKDSKIYKLIKEYFGWFGSPIMRHFRRIRAKKHMHKDFKSFKKSLYTIKNKAPQTSCIYYLGVTAQPNLGDMAQHYCILKWIKENFPNYYLLCIESDAVCDKKLGFLDLLEKSFNINKDIIIFQSGYNTQDLGGNHPLMHQLVINTIPNAKILMMPQTIFFQSEANKRTCAENHNKAHNMLFLARDFTSYNIAKEMFPNIKVIAFPDIVTTLIGTKTFKTNRNGVCICTRNDGEKYYTEDEISLLAKKLQLKTNVMQKDTNGKEYFMSIRNNLKNYIEQEIESYSNFKVTITDRYHGTIFSLCAGTPVIIIKTTDHKVTTGAEWFKDIYKDYIFVAKDLDDAYNLCNKLLNLNLSYKLPAYFKEKYYDKLKTIFITNN